MENLKEKMSQLGDKLANKPLNVPIQQIVPIKSTEVQLTVWVKKELIVRAKTLAAQKDLTLKEITNNALENYLKQFHGT
ncbi:MAG: hypothetical protein E6Q85_00460 [Thiothrix sp.]|nr:MAG: hypothetical protein E6Q85_00460 [Thiothrix sp.]